MLISNGAVSCYPASTVNLIVLVRWWKVFIVSALSNMKVWNLASRDLKTQPFCQLGVLVRCLARTCESPTIPTNT